MVLISGVRHRTNNCFTNRRDSFILAVMEEQTTEKQLPDSVELLKTLLLSAQKQLKEKDRKIHSLHSLINAYQEEKRLAQAHRFGASSEKDSPQQRLFDEAEVGADTPPSTAPMPPQPIPKSQASPGFLAYVVTSKYADALPLYRQCNILKRSGIECARNTLCHQVVKAGLSKRELNI
ncbi:MAG: transposase [Pseudomonadales bacterium]|nr:transposase [Pseudomonadales bacterium]